MTVTETSHRVPLAEARSPFPVPAQPRPALPRRVMFFGKSMRRSRCSGALVDALELSGATVRWFKFARNRRWLGQAGAEDRARRVFRKFRPDLLFVLSRDIPMVLLDEFCAQVPVVIWIEDLLTDVDDELVTLSARANLISVSDPSRIAALRARGVENIVYQMSGFSPRYHRPWPATREVRDCVFVGGPGRSLLRAELLARIAEQHDVDVFGCGWKKVRHVPPRMAVHGPIGNRRYRRLCAESRIVLGSNESNSTPGYFSNRTWLTLACGGFHLTHYVPGLERVFERGVHLDWYHDADEALERIDHYLAHPEKRRAIAAAGHEFALAEHQYRHRIGRILAELGARA